MGVGPGHLSAGYRRPAGLLTQGGLVDPHTVSSGAGARCRAGNRPGVPRV